MSGAHVCLLALPSDRVPSHDPIPAEGGLDMWTEVGGIALCTGPAGVGKSISLRRFLSTLDERRHRLVQFSYLPGTVTGFLRSLSRALGLRMRLHGADLFDAASEHLASYEETHGPHPIVVIDDAEGLSVPVLDTLRRLTAHDLDAELVHVEIGSETPHRDARHEVWKPAILGPSNDE